jgi:hypothetical protein
MRVETTTESPRTTGVHARDAPRSATKANLAEPTVAAVAARFEPACASTGWLGRFRRDSVEVLESIESRGRGGRGAPEPWPVRPPPTLYVVAIPQGRNSVASTIIMTAGPPESYGAPAGYLPAELCSECPLVAENRRGSASTSRPVWRNQDHRRSYRGSTSRQLRPDQA